MTLYELVVINKLVKQYAKTALFEIGTFNGRTTLNMALNAPPACNVFTLDMPGILNDDSTYPLDTHEKTYADKLASGTVFTHHDASAMINQLYGDSAVFDFTDYENTCDMVFIDGSHTYAYVKNDTERAFRLLKKEGGVFCGITVVCGMA